MEPATVDLMLSRQGLKITVPGADADQGLTWWLHYDGDRLQRFGHGGAHMYGFVNDAAVWPSERLAVSVSANVWNMTNFFLDATPMAITRQIDAWVRLGGGSGRTSHPSWGWKLSFVRGGRFVEACNGALGLRDPLTIEDAAAAAASVEAQRERPPNWDAAGFLEGARAMLAVPATPAGIAQFVATAPLSKAEIAQALYVLEGPTEARWAPSLW